jgi:hypothetical protein
VDVDVGMSVLLTMLALALPSAAEAKPPKYPGCHTSACERRVDRRQHRRTVARWKRTARPYAAWLRRTRACESGSAGGYRLSTTGNGFWFAYQHTPSSWYAAGGRSRNWRPAGVRSLQPTPAEQDFRAVITLRQQGRGAWPVCG